ncbi:hypothetical protein KDA_75030 [Dictyobacter alpinus]|uniref:Uncharacterized protein n=1 Tax=Dictyobacter alpinus TaxID=2014873 RepID=A0A402BL22_9CHLR|nr:hypothetical protein [Dictyobacter alpinus]GCE32019.1 hypothetical protein KDA_75030 [Dictyobacter alpinus]
MPPSSRMTAAAALAPQSLVEQTHLPRILVRVKGAVKYYAYVNCYIAGPKFRFQGTDVTPLYYLSLVAMRGQGTILDGIWSALTASNPYDVYLDGVGTVVLAHRRPDSAALGYTLHWNYRQADLPSQDLQRVIESNMLTMYDPLRGAAPVQKERKTKKGRRINPKKKGRGKERAEGSTATKKTLGVLEERQNREKHPLFLLLVPGNEHPERLPGETDEGYRTHCELHTTAFLAESYFAFLDLRAPWAMALEWCDYLWQRGVERGENVPLTVWCAQVSSEETPDGEKQRPPVFSQAWLCQPNIALLDSDLKQARRDGRISNLVSPDEEEADAYSSALA